MSKKRYSFHGKEREIQDLLHNVLFTDITVRASNTPFNFGSDHYVASFVNEHEELCGLIVSSLSLSAICSILFTDMDPNSLDEIVEQGTLDDFHFENLSEIMNILSQIFTWRKNAPAKLFSVKSVSDIDPAVQEILRQTSMYDSFWVSIENFPDQEFSLYAPPKEEPPIFLRVKPEPAPAKSSFVSSSSTEKPTKKIHTTQSKKEKHFSITDVNFFVVFGILLILTLLGFIFYYL